MFKLIFSILLTAPLFLSGQVENNVCFFFNGSKINSSDINRMMNFIYLENNIKLNSVKVIHITKDNESKMTWINKKKSVEYNPSKYYCGFDVCQSINSIYSYIKQDKNILYNCQSKSPCKLNDIDLEIRSLNSKSESIIIEKIKEGISTNKVLKKKQSIFFYIEELEDFPKLDINFMSQAIVFNEGGVNTIESNISGNATSISWEPKQGLDCYDCFTPKFIGQTNVTYLVEIKDSVNCQTVSKEVNVSFEKSCLCEGEISQTEILFDQADRKYYSRSKDLESDWKWQITANQSGGYMFDLFCNSNCTRKFKVVILDPSGKRIKTQFLDLNDENDRKPRKNEVLRIDLGSVSELLPNGKFYCVVEITPIDNNDLECESKKYISPKIRFTKCTED